MDSKLSRLIVGLALAVAAPLASAAPEPQDAHPRIGGAETISAEAAGMQGINAPANTNGFWYAGTSGWPSQ